MTQHILAVDDEPLILTLLERIVREKTKYQIVTTSNPLEVLDILAQNRFDLIITDLKMPGMSGMEILRKIKEKKREEEVIIMTAYGSLESAVEALSQGVFDYITKPFKKEQLLFTIDRGMRLQRIKHEAKNLSEIFNIDLYEDALSAFEREYIQKLSERCGNDNKAMSARSGLSVESIQAMKDKKKTNNI